jgi:hypothetical protein
MLRALRFSVRLGFALDPAIERAIAEGAPTLTQITRHRLADETQRFLTSGLAKATLTEFSRRGLLRPLLALEAYAWFFAPEAVREPLPALGELLDGLDRWVADEGETLPPTVVLLALVTTLARPEFRTYLAGSSVRQSGRADEDAPAAEPDAKLLRRYKRDLPRMLTEWGLLRGQVEPALRILGAARLLLSHHPRTGERRAPQAGEREAWLLLGIVGPGLGAEPESVRQGLARVHELPDLPILDHPRPTRRGAAAVESATPERAPSDPLPPRSRRRRRKRKGKPT